MAPGIAPAEYSEGSRTSIRTVFDDGDRTSEEIEVKSYFLGVPEPEAALV